MAPTGNFTADSQQSLPIANIKKCVSIPVVKSEDIQNHSLQNRSIKMGNTDLVAFGRQSLCRSAHTTESNGRKTGRSYTMYRTLSSGLCCQYVCR